MEDVDNEADNDDERNHEVHLSVCLPLPEEDAPPIPKSTVVLSVYPGTTSFYRGVIVNHVRLKRSPAFAASPYTLLRPLSSRRRRMGSMGSDLTTIMTSKGAR